MNMKFFRIKNIIITKVISYCHLKLNILVNIFFRILQYLTCDFSIQHDVTLRCHMTSVLNLIGSFISLQLYK